MVEHALAAADISAEDSRVGFELKEPVALRLAQVVQRFERDRLTGPVPPRTIPAEEQARSSASV
jgi:hypothetical protein